MARSRKKGVSVQDILSISPSEFNRMSESELRWTVGRLVSAGNKRLRTFENREESSPAYRYVMDNGGKFTTRGKNLNQLRSEYVRAKNFFESETGTVTSWKRVKRDTVKRLQSRGLNVTEAEHDKLWRAYNELRKLDDRVTSRSLKYEVLEKISELVPDTTKSAEVIADIINSEISSIYEENERLKYGEGKGVSDFFEM